MAKIVVFSDFNARIIKGVDPDDFKGAKNILIDPDLSQVKGIPPHGWKLEGGKILPYTPDEIEKRRVQVMKNDAPEIMRTVVRRTRTKRLILAMLIAIASFILGRVF